MLERSTSVLRVLSVGLAALVLLQLAQVAFRKDVLAGIRMPQLATQIIAVSGADTNSTGRAAIELPPATKAFVDRVTASEIFGPVPRPAKNPVALLGLAGRDAILRTTDGQTALLRVGEESGGIRLLQIGTNRVVVEQDGRKQELTIFSGFGSDSLLPKEKETTK